MHRTLKANLGLPVLRGDPAQTLKLLNKINPLLQECLDFQLSVTKESVALQATGEEPVLENLRQLLVREPSRSFTINLSDLQQASAALPKYQLEDLHFKPETLKAIVAAGIRSVAELTNLSALELRLKYQLSRRQIENIQFCLDGVQLALQKDAPPSQAA